jgi:hypothetical protein
MGVRTCGAVVLVVASWCAAGPSRADGDAWVETPNLQTVEPVQAEQVARLAALGASAGTSHGPEAARVLQGMPGRRDGGVGRAVVGARMAGWGAGGLVAVGSAGLVLLGGLAGVGLLGGALGGWAKMPFPAVPGARPDPAPASAAVALAAAVGVGATVFLAGGVAWGLGGLAGAAARRVVFDALWNGPASQPPPQASYVPAEVWPADRARALGTQVVAGVLAQTAPLHAVPVVGPWLTLKESQAQVTAHLSHARRVVGYPRMWDDVTAQLPRAWAAYAGVWSLVPVGWGLTVAVGLGAGLAWWGTAMGPLWLGGPALALTGLALALGALTMVHLGLALVAHWTLPRWLAGRWMESGAVRPGPVTHDEAGVARPRTGARVSPAKVR